MASIHLIGVGSNLGNGSIGLVAIDRLEQVGLPSKYPEHQLSLAKLGTGPALLEHMRGADLAIIIDALVSDYKPGTVMPLRPNQIAQEEWVLSGHSMSIAETIAFGEALGDLPERLLLLGIAVGQELNLTSDVEITSETLDGLQRHIGLEMELISC